MTDLGLIMIYLQLFYTFFKIGLFGFGGGYAILSLIQHDVVEQYGWMSQQDFVDMVAISQVTPGPIGINAATYVGYQSTQSVLGSAVATFSIILPSLIIMLALSKLYFRYKNNRYVKNVLQGLKYVVVGLIAAAALLLMNGDTFIDVWSYVLFGMVLICSMFFHWHPIPLIVVCGVLGYFIYY